MKADAVVDMFTHANFGQFYRKRISFFDLIFILCLFFDDQTQILFCFVNFEHAVILSAVATSLSLFL